MDIVPPANGYGETGGHPKKGNPMCPPSMGDTWGYTWSKVTNPREVVGWLHVTRFEECMASDYVLMCVHLCVRSVP